MCEIYAYSGEVNKTFNDELREFFSHSGEHPNGWGLAVEENGRINLEKEAVQASESHYLRERRRAITCVSACGSIWKGPQLSHTFVMRRSALLSMRIAILLWERTAAAGGGHWSTMERYLITRRWTTIRGSRQEVQTVSVFCCI